MICFLRSYVLWDQSLRNLPESMWVYKYWIWETRSSAVASETRLLSQYCCHTMPKSIIFHANVRPKGLTKISKTHEIISGDEEVRYKLWLGSTTYFSTFRKTQTPLKLITYLESPGESVFDSPFKRANMRCFCLYIQQITFAICGDVGITTQFIHLNSRIDAIQFIIKNYGSIHDWIVH